jgi:hypothetical protein
VLGALDNKCNHSPHSILFIYTAQCRDAIPLLTEVLGFLARIQ